MVVADAGPLRYLVLIEAIDVLSNLFGRVLVPEIVVTELSRPSTPAPVHDWLGAMPAWMERRTDPPPLANLPPQLGAGERAAIALANTIEGALLGMDDRAGVSTARERGIAATGTLGVLVPAARLGQVDLPTAFARLKATNFRYRPELLDALLAKDRGEA